LGSSVVVWFSETAGRADVEGADFFDARLYPVDEAVVDPVSRVEIAEENVVVDGVAVLGEEAVDIFLGEEKAIVVQQREVLLERATRLGHAGFDFRAELLAVVVRVFQHVGDRGGDFAHFLVGRSGEGRRRGGQE